jgi:hypothetical protein
MIWLVKKPIPVQAVQWTGDNFEEVKKFCGESIYPSGPVWQELRLLAGMNGAQGLVLVPINHWIFGGPGDYWPVADEYVQQHYDIMHLAPLDEPPCEEME